MSQLRNRFFIGCEGENEFAYCGVVQLHLNALDRPVHLVRERLNGGGPSSLLRQAIERRDRKTAGGEFVGSFLLLDNDKAEHDRIDVVRFAADAERERFRLVWARPRFEWVLHGHFADSRSDDHVARGLDELFKPYTKRLPIHVLQRQITLDAIHAACRRNPDLKAMLTAIGLLGE